MPNLKIAVMLGSLRMEPDAGMKKVVEMGVTGLHVGAGGPFSPEALDKAGRKALVEKVRSMGLEISAISAWGGEVDLCEEEPMAKNVARARDYLELAADLGCRIWQAHVGVMPSDTSDPRWSVLLDAAGRIAAHGEKAGACLAIETGPEPPVVLRRLIETVGSKAIRVNYDPANLVIWPAYLASKRGERYDKEAAIHDYEPVEGAKTLGKYVVHTHAKDALVHDDGRYQEVPLGDGWIDWPRYTSLLRQEGFDGYYAIEREVGENPVADIERAVEFLKTL